MPDQPQVGSTLRRLWIPVALAVALLGLNAVADAVSRSEPVTKLHYAPNHNFGFGGRYLPGQVGFNVADVDTLRQLESLPPGVKGLVWVGQCDGVSAKFLSTVRPYLRAPKLFGFYLMDDPDPRSGLIAARYSGSCTAANLKAESDWIHANAPGAKTFIALMNLASSAKPWFGPAYNPANLHIDLYGLDPYPCRSELRGCDYDMIDRYVAAAENSGIPRSRMVPIYQAFGGGGWTDNGGGSYSLPTAEQERRILSRWGMLVSRPVFDYAYSWGSQRHDRSLADAADLREIFAVHNAAGRPKRLDWRR